MFTKINQEQDEVSIVQEIRSLEKRNTDIDHTKIITDLHSLIDEINHLEMAKYPASAFDVSRGVINHDGKDIQAMYVKFKKKDGTLTNEELLHMNRVSIRLRELSLIAGIWNMYACDKSGEFMKHSNRIQKILIKYIIIATEEHHHSTHAKIFDSLSPHNPKDVVDHFIKDLAKELASVTGDTKSDVIRQIRNAEQYYVSEYNQQRALVFESTIDGQTICQVDIPVGNQLTEEQKIEYMKIHDKFKPAWFTYLASWEQDWLLQYVPKTIDSDWDKFLTLFQSSAMQQLPGLKNTRTNYLMEIDEKSGEYQLLSTSKKTATLIPYEMPEAQQKNYTNENVTQLISILKEDAKSNFDRVWGSVLGKTQIKPLIFIGSLLSNTMGASEDTALTNHQIDAVHLFAESEKDYHIIAGNEPINIFRSVVVQDEKRWLYVNEIMKYAGEFYQEISKPEVASLLDEQQKMQKDLIESAIVQLDKLKNMNETDRIKFNMTERRNHEAFKMAYACILVEAMGGAVSTNCKSGKDRTGLDEIYRSAMLLYFKKYHKLPGFTDEGQDRENFIKIFSHLFNTMKTQEAAAMNTPGSFGLKDSAVVVCADIAHHLGKSYHYSNQRADMNKPQLLTKDEAAQKNETRKLDKRLKDDDDVESLLEYLQSSSRNIYTRANQLMRDTPDAIHQLHYMVDDITGSLEGLLRRQESWDNNDLTRLAERAVKTMASAADAATIDEMMTKLRTSSASVSDYATKTGTRVKVEVKSKAENTKKKSVRAFSRFVVNPIRRLISSRLEKKTNQEGNLNQVNVTQMQAPPRPNTSLPDINLHSSPGAHVDIAHSIFGHHDTHVEKSTESQSIHQHVKDKNKNVMDKKDENEDEHEHQQPHH